MIDVSFPPHLRRFIAVPDQCSAEGQTIREVVDDLEQQFPGVSGYLLQENGAIRTHVNFFLDQKLLLDRNDLDLSVEGAKELVIMQALSGG